MVKPKPKSKRTPVRLRNKIEKAGAAKQRKMRKEAKKNPEWRSRLKKDPGIPNLFPYKDKILHEIEEKKRLKSEDLLRKKQEAKDRRRGVDATAEEDKSLDGSTSDALIDPDLSDEEMDDPDGDTSNAVANPMAALLASAKARAAEYANEESPDDEAMSEDSDTDPTDPSSAAYSVLPSISTSETYAILPHRPESSRRAFDKIFKSVVSASDVILYVLDARDPDGTRSQQVERSIMAASATSEKRLILVLNKIDLIPPAQLQAWLLHLRRYFPTLPLRASGPAANAQTFNHKALTVQGTSTTLFKALKAFANAKQLKRSITVGVIGYPNVGKSSVINALTARLGARSESCPVGAEAGVTTGLREVKLDGKLKLLDSPGIVFPHLASGLNPAAERARLVLLNAIPPKQIEDPIAAVSLLLQRLTSTDASLAKLRELYALPPLVLFADDLTTDFLVQVARKRGRLGKGGVPNVQSAATTVITDWRDGRIQGWVDAPVLPVIVDASSSITATNATNGGPRIPGTTYTTEAPAADRKEIVAQWAEEFKIEGLWGDGLTEA